MSLATESPASVSVLYRPCPSDMPIPDRFNLCLVAAVFMGAVALLWLGSHVESLVRHAGSGRRVLLSAADELRLVPRGGTRQPALGSADQPLARHDHGLVVPDALQHVPGDAPGAPSPQPDRSRNVRSVLSHRPQADPFRPVVRHSVWIVLAVRALRCLLVCAVPGVLRTRVFRQARSSNYLLGDIRDLEVRSIRREVLLTVGFFTLLFWLLDLRWQAVLILYACFSFNWSTRQYVGHAFSRRDVIEGAWNLRHFPFMSWILLHGEWDLNHHRRPEVRGTTCRGCPGQTSRASVTSGNTGASGWARGPTPSLRRNRCAISRSASINEAAIAFSGLAWTGSCCAEAVVLGTAQTLWWMLVYLGADWCDGPAQRARAGSPRCRVEHAVCTRFDRRVSLAQSVASRSRRSCYGPVAKSELWL